MIELWFRFGSVVGLIVIPCGFQGLPGCLGFLSGWSFLGYAGFLWVVPGFSGFLRVSPGLVAQRVLWLRVHAEISM